MAAVSQQTATLLGGISQQPDPNKLAGQVREAVNVQLNPTFGCEKRPPSKFVSVLANDISLLPEASYNETIKWFNIFRDSQEKYIVSIYRDESITPSTRVRVWDCETGEERCVFIYPSSQLYLDSTSPTSYRHLTIGDYTLITNPSKIVTMNATDGGGGGGGGGETPEPPVNPDQEALVVVNQIAYNTTYNINFLRAGSAATTKVYSASTLSVAPSSFEEDDDGGCRKATTQSFIIDQGDKEGLSFDLTTICQPTQKAETEENNSYPTAVDLVPGFNDEATDLAFAELGLPSEYGNGSNNFITDTAIGNGFSATCNLRIDFRASGIVYDDDGSGAGSVLEEGTWTFVGASIVSYDSDYDWGEGDQVSVSNVYFDITSIATPDDTVKYEYKSVYRSSVRMRSGGTGWRTGDTVSVVMAEKSYQVKVETETFGYGFESEASVSYTTQSNVESGGNLDVGDIVGALTTEINTTGIYNAEPIGNVIYIQRLDRSPFNIQANGGTNERSLYAIKGSVNDVSLLPIQCKDGVTLLVRNTVDSTADDYYVRFSSAESSIPGQGAWEETVKPLIPTTLDPSSLPQALIRKADGNFVLRPLSPSHDCSADKSGSWAPRDVGDLESNPDPSFVGRGISNMFFFMNRLGFLSQDSVVMSQPGQYFNFFVGSAIAISDADPIDMTAASSDEPSFLKDAIAVPQGTLLFAENAQYLLSTTEVAFGPSTAKIVQISDYSYDSKIKPLETGVSIMFHTESSTFSKVFEMAIPNTDQSRPQVAEITRIIPEYIPPSINWSASNPNNNQVFFGYGDNTAYNFSFFNVANERSMSGWTKWVFNYDVAHMGFFQDRAYVILYNPATKAFILSTIDPLDNPGDSTISAAGREFTPRLDVLIPKSSCTFREINATDTLVTIPCFLAVKDKDNKPKMITTVFGNLGNATYFQKYPLVVGDSCENPPPTPGPCVPTEECAGSGPGPGTCDGVECPPGEVCSEGFCFPDNPGPGPGPGPGDPCDDVTCPPGEECFGGFCVPVDPCAGIECPPGQICLDGVCKEIDDPCNFVECDEGYTCIDGTCVEDDPGDPCAGVQCPETQRCFDGDCIPDGNLVDQDYYISPDNVCLEGLNSLLYIKSQGLFTGSVQARANRIVEVTNITYEGEAKDIYDDETCTNAVYEIQFRDEFGTNSISLWYGGGTCINQDGDTYQSDNFEWIQTIATVEGYEDVIACKDPSNFFAEPVLDPLLFSTSPTIDTSLVDTPNSFIISKEDAALDFSVGYDYPMRVELPSFYLIGGDKQADRNNVPIIENVKTYLYLSGTYQAKLSRLGYEDRIIDLEVNKCDIYKADSNPIAEVGVSEIPLFCQGDLATVEISSESPLPAAITGYGWEGHFNTRGVKPLKRQ